MKKADFVNTIYSYYRANKRPFAWRKTKNPYRVLVSEIMLQQTQTSRVISKYESWLKKFPDVQHLASASVAEVLKEWQGLGYNRRALALKKTAEVVVKKYRSRFPKTYEEILELPGIGPYTAGAVMAFAYNKSFPIIETNIRTVFIHFFFRDKKGVHDKDILKLVEETLDTENPREWYYALMDYGVMLKKTMGNLNTKSRHYTKQTPFKGSNREVRSMILKELQQTSATAAQLRKKLTTVDKDKIDINLSALQKEGFIKRKGQVFLI